MKKILLGLVAALLFIGCSSEEQVDVNVEPSLVVGKALNIALNDQFDKAHTLDTTTKKVIFVFSEMLSFIK